MSPTDPPAIKPIAAFRSLTETYHQTSYPAIDPSNPANSATGKTVVISGGTQGIGYSIAQSFATAGATNIVLLARRQEALDTASAKLRASNASADVWTYRLDIRDAAAVADAFAAIRTRLNQGSSSGSHAKDIDVLVANAAVLDQGQTAIENTPEMLDASFGTNLFGNLNLVRNYLLPETPAIPMAAVMGRVKDTSGARAPGNEKVFIDVSTASTFLNLPGQAVYAASKGAFTLMMRHLQSEVEGLPGAPVRVHSLQPGTVWTEGVEKRMEGELKLAWDDVSLPGSFAVWLASPAAAFLKGRFVWANWDVEELVGMKKRFEEDPEFCTINLRY